jgi:hypothetical protein
MSLRKLFDRFQALAFGRDNSPDTTSDTPKISNPVSEGPTVIFHDVASRLSLDRLRTQADDEQKRLILARLSKQTETGFGSLLTKHRDAVEVVPATVVKL